MWGRSAGGGSCEKDSPVEIIAMEKEEQASLMHDLRLGKGERHAHKTSQTLAQRVIPPLGGKPKPIKLKEVTGDKAYEREGYWTFYYKSQGYKITNHDLAFDE